MLRLLKPILLLIILGGVTAGGYYLYQTKIKKSPAVFTSNSSSSSPDHQSQVLGVIQDLGSSVALPNKVSLPAGDELLELTTSQLQQLGAQAQTVTSHLSNIITPVENKTDSTNSASTNQPIHEKALEYGRYIYCQEVIKDYEATH